MKGSISIEDNSIAMKLVPAIGGDEASAKIDRHDASEWPVRFFTSTTNMKDWIGNVVSVDGDRCRVKGVYRGRMVEINGIRICSEEIKQPGDRVMVTEHMDVDGKMGFIATKRRVLIEHKGSSVNYACIGWSNEKKCRYLRFDVYTGDHKVFEQEPVYSRYRGE